MHHADAWADEPALRGRLERYLELLYEEASRRNLTRVRREEAWKRHIEESLSLLPLHSWAAGEVVLDFGSGGGLPGIPLAIALPQVRVVLLERNLAKARFLERCLMELSLDGAEVVGRNAEELAREKPHPRADILVSRAAAPPLRLIPQVAPFLKPRGAALLLVGGSVGVSADLRLLCQRHHLADPEIVEAGQTRVLRVRNSR
jgi:16S rRNA (guanine527-N7)-methyltransferase